MPEGTPTVTVTGSSSRQPAALSRIPFSDISVQNGAQRSHAIPQQMYQKSLPDLFKLIKEAQLPDGKLPFDPDNFLDNGQALEPDPKLS